MAAIPLHAAPLDGKLVIVSAFPHDTTEPLRRAFLKRHPGIEVEVKYKSAAESVKLIESMAERTTVDLVWGAAPDMFEMLKKAGRLDPYQPDMPGIPRYIGSARVSDPKGYYTGFSVSGYGFMWNKRYLNTNRLQAPSSWSDLARPVYRGHVAMSSAFRSGPTHLIIENILQTYGWEEGWKLIKAIGGNLKTVTLTGYQVARGVREGEFGTGVVIDSFAISSKARMYPVEFRYPSGLVVLPASVAIVKGAPNRTAAERFIDFLLSEEAQYLLIDKRIARLPIRSEVYESVPDGFPNPFDPAVINRAVDFDLDTSIARYTLINTLFDVMVTFNLSSLQQVTRVVDSLEERLRLRDNPAARELLLQAREMMAFLPIAEEKSRDQEYVARFSQERGRQDDSIRQQGIELEKQWTEAFRKRYRRAGQLARQGLDVLDRMRIAESGKH
jgi:ABC-type Fe3+ transport system substrate-binding protein